MPGGDRTGPVGYGPRTGRSMGFCAGAPQPGYANPGFGRGMGRGGGRGRGFGRWSTTYPYPNVTPAYIPPAQPAPDEEIAYLEEAAQNLEQELKNIKARIDSLRSQE